MTERPDGIIITISTKMLKEKGVRTWLRNFLQTMDKNETGWSYWMRLGAVPQHEVLYVYLCIGGRLRYRALCVGYEGEREVTFDNGKKMCARAWVILAGPLVKAPGTIKMKGFRGFRYTERLF